MSISRKVTIYDISERAGVSASTVASVMNGSWENRRITKATADRIRVIASELGYTTNLQARGLRISNSGMIGMILPMLDNRYFSSMAASFETVARSRNLIPVVASTLRDPQQERSTVETLIAHNVDALLIAGATDPDSVAELCEKAHLKHINVDLPGKHGASVISDNYNGARVLTHQIASRRSHRTENSFYFIGGVDSDHNTRARVRGYKDELAALNFPVHSDAIITNGYGPDAAARTIRDIYKKLNGLPEALFVNSTSPFEGVVSFLKTLPVDEVRECSIGCFDWDPFIEVLHFPVVMVRQNVQAMIERAFELLDESVQTNNPPEMIPTELIIPRGL
ncbi:transcriptional regulator [Brucella intermedia]|uniref:LacI family fructose operon transcriptional repressor n=2 Tax=Brucella intermedia TaxID=94625 RepID=A0ABR6ALD0_9HYPH|nr:MULTISPECIES: LacI family DNA-binding transcriptional regulator [Brucella/Ochrobactrum group]KAB2670175.1 transcriptional regulator [Ochrobactrum sp. LMG 5442]PJT19497.1 transcriptional regulator [Ochrobactrum sp. 30A/1000/2015]PJT39287.1 transcriptional regulator [Ochrobactrum sp. 27A/999/2015]PJT43580.1 transcriptional regulator [Ochrobactrum sp. 23A/997/2015]KAB2694693.1 transcriptional regulator [Brucella intermedia]